MFAEFAYLLCCAVNKLLLYLSDRKQLEVIAAANCQTSHTPEPFRPFQCSLVATLKDFVRLLQLTSTCSRSPQTFQTTRHCSCLTF